MQALAQTSCVATGLAVCGLLLGGCGSNMSAPSRVDAAFAADAGAVADPGDAAFEPDAGVSPGDAASGPAGDSGIAPSRFAGHFASPTIVRVGSTYHVYLAKQSITVGGTTKVFHVPHATYQDGVWSAPHEALPHLGKGARPNGVVWAPAVGKISNNHWMLYYTAAVAPTPDHPDTQKKCIWRAHATGPDGPFVDDFAGPLVCQSVALWSIDPYVVRDARGNWNLAARIDLGNTINSIQIRRLTPDGEHFASGSSWHLVARNYQDSWDHHVMENAGVVRLAPPNGQSPHWFVFYSARQWDNNSYAIGYVDCGPNIFGLSGNGCRKETPNGPWLGTDQGNDLWGPGTPTFYTDPAGHELMSIQAWHYSGGVADGSPNQAENRREGQIMKTYQISIDDQYRPHVKLQRTDL